APGGGRCARGAQRAAASDQRLSAARRVRRRRRRHRRAVQHDGRVRRRQNRSRDFALLPPLPARQCARREGRRMSEGAINAPVVTRRSVAGGVPFRPGRRHPPLARRFTGGGGPERTGGAIGGSALRAVVRMLAYLAITIALAPVQLVALLTNRRLAERIPQLHHRLSCRLLGFRIERRGRISRARPTLFVGNHSSYLDIIIYGALISG